MKTGIPVFNFWEYHQQKAFITTQKWESDYDPSQGSNASWLLIQCGGTEEYGMLLPNTHGSVSNKKREYKDSKMNFGDKNCTQLNVSTTKLQKDWNSLS